MTEFYDPIEAYESYLDAQYSIRRRCLRKVSDERHNQVVRWGVQTHDPQMWYAILGEEFGEVGKEIAEGRIQPFDTQAYVDELIQVAAVALAAAESVYLRGELPAP